MLILLVVMVVGLAEVVLVVTTTHHHMNPEEKEVVAMVRYITPVAPDKQVTQIQAVEAAMDRMVLALKPVESVEQELFF